MYKNNSQDSSKIKGYSPLQLHGKLKVNCSEVGYYSYTQTPNIKKGLAQCIQHWQDS